MKRDTLRISGQKPVVWVVQSWWVEDIYAGIAAAGVKKGWEVVAPMRHLRVGNLLAPSRVDGVIIFRGALEEWIEPVKKLGVPIVNIDPYDDALEAPKVIWDDFEIGYTAALHLAACNPAELFFVRWPGNSRITEIRSAGFARGAAQIGIPCREIPRSEFIPRKLADKRKIGLFAGNDSCAVNLMFACLNDGLRVPEDCSILGADDDRLTCEIQPVPLSSINPGLYRRGVTAADVLEKLMRGEKASSEKIICPLDGVTARGSTRCCDTGDTDLDRLVRHFRENAWRPVGVDTLCRECAIPVRRAIHLLKSRMESSPLQLLRACRLTLAARFSSSGKLTLEAVAKASGFGTAAALRRAKLAANEPA